MSIRVTGLAGTRGLVALAACGLVMSACSSAPTISSSSSRAVLKTPPSAAPSSGAAATDQKAVDQALDHLIRATELLQAPGEAPDLLEANYGEAVTELGLLDDAMTAGIAGVPGPLATNIAKAANAAERSVADLAQCLVSPEATDCTTETKQASDDVYQVGFESSGLIRLGTRSSDEVLALLGAESRSVSASAEAEVPVEETASPTAEAFTYSIVCSSTDDVDDLSYANIAEYIAVIKDDLEYPESCSVNLANPDTFKPDGKMKALLKPIRNFTDYTGWAGKFASVMESCADDGMGLAPDSVAEFKAAFTLCPGHPDAKVWKAKAAGAFIEDDGTYELGEIRAGTWVTTDAVSDCYWERTTPHGDIIQNNFITNASKGARVTIGPRDGSFTTRGCGSWKRVS